MEGSGFQIRDNMSIYKLSKISSTENSMVEGNASFKDIKNLITSSSQVAFPVINDFMQERLAQERANGKTLNNNSTNNSNKSQNKSEKKSPQINDSNKCEAPHILDENN